MIINISAGLKCWYITHKLKKKKSVSAYKSSCPFRSNVQILCIVLQAWKGYVLGSKISDTMISNIESSQLLSSILSLLSSFQIYMRSISNIIKYSREKTFISMAWTTHLSTCTATQTSQNLERLM